MNVVIIFVAFVTTVSTTHFEPDHHKNWKLLDNNICGQVSSSRIIGGKEASMNAFPWVASIGYQIDPSKPKDITFRCGGVLINSNTVLTAAHCAVDLPKNIVLDTIRLGEHDTATNPDCQNDVCADPVVDFKPEEIILPKNYNEVPLKHDLALIRLKRKVTYTDYVRPICLPSGKFYRKNLVGRMTEVTGWGIYDMKLLQSSQKLQVVTLPIVNNSECIKYYPKVARIGPTQLCIGGIIGKDSCSGDSGGPAMMVDDSNGEPHYYLVGIVSFGAKECGGSEAPAVYTKITSYLKWVLDNLEKTTHARVLKL
ncbi:hypothetical protein RUM44_000076 [Polyplax serrata]|uniref:Peptidase S1 domain-containing protein n=1 Tax=Polyplax serrata TaxID=468196 RepID=A0ABR1B4H5_POLSC